VCVFGCVCFVFVFWQNKIFRLTECKYDPSLWEVTQRGDFSHIYSKVTGRTCVVPKERERKVFKLLDAASVDAVFSSQNNTCGCVSKRKPACFLHLTKDHVLTLRESVCSSNVQNAYNHVVSTLPAVNQQQIEKQRKFPNSHVELNYEIAGQKVCREFFSAALGISLSYLSVIRKRVLGLEVSHHYKVMQLNTKTDTKFNICVAFWDSFFSENCQSPREGERLFPVALSRRDIYVLYFLPWFINTYLPPENKEKSKTTTQRNANLEIIHTIDGRVVHAIHENNSIIFREVNENGDYCKILQPTEICVSLEHFSSQPSKETHEEECQEEDDHPYGIKEWIPPGCPKLAIFNRARFHERFQDVKKRAKHFHVRCLTCSRLLNLLRKGWSKGYRKEK